VRQSSNQRKKLLGHAKSPDASVLTFRQQLKESNNLFAEQFSFSAIAEAWMHNIVERPDTLACCIGRRAIL
jgi:hypothetical protein